MWFDNGELDSLPEQLSEKECAAEAVSALTALRSPRSSIWNQSQYFDCPVCGDTMNRRNYETVSGIILNRCSTDGTWLDYSNAVSLFKLIADGRLQEIRDRAQIAIADQTHRHAVLEAARLKAQWQEPRDADAHVPVKVIAIRNVVWALLDFFW